MKKLLCLISIALLLCAATCSPSSNNSSTAIISGTIKNATTKSAILTNVDMNKRIILNPDGSFIDTVSLSMPSHFTLNIARRQVNIFLEPGDELQLNFNFNNYTRSVTWSGNAANNNRYLFHKETLMQSFERSSHKWYTLPEDEFLSEISQQKDKLLHHLDTSQSLSDQLIKSERREVELYYLQQIKKYPSSFAYFTRSDQPTISSEFAQMTKGLNLYDATEYKHSPTLRQIAKDDYSIRFSESYKNSNDLGQAFIDVSKTLPKGLARDKLMIEYMSLIFKPNDRMDEVYDFFIASSTNENDKSQITQQYNSLKYLAKGEPAPNFSYENINGGQTTLKELRGKYVYIDIWATWCGPCKVEIPHLKELEEEYKDKNIAFVSISVDKPEKYSVWKKMVQDKQMGGYQLITDNTTATPFVKHFKIRGIPHFIILDPKGKIHSAAAPRASNANIRNILNGLLQS